MLTLSILRHAKSSWDDPGLDDFERPLAKRGAKAMPHLAKFLLRENLRPDVVLCSGAVRARATLTLLLAELGAPTPEVAYDDALYLAPPDRILARLGQTEARYLHVLVVGHNPGLYALVLELAGSGERKELAALATEFPTGALAVLSFEGEDWAALKPASGRLEHFTTPRRLGG